jgi:L-lactate utilization protein LutB
MHIVELQQQGEQMEMEEENQQRQLQRFQEKKRLDYWRWLLKTNNRSFLSNRDMWIANFAGSTARRGMRAEGARERTRSNGTF